jgi:hypothetical protein
VYGPSVPLPFNVSELHFFRAHLLPTAMHLCPYPHLAPPKPLLPRCADDECSGWLDPPPVHPPSAAVAGLSFIWPPVWPPMVGTSALNISPKLRRKSRHSQFLLVQPTTRRAGAHNNSWLEVIRVTPPYLTPGAAEPGCNSEYGWQRSCQTWRPGSRYPYQPEGYVQRPECQTMGCCREGRNYGCWFWPARGSGIHINVGRTRILHSRSHAEHSGFGLRAVVYNTKYRKNVTIRVRGNDCMCARPRRRTPSQPSPSGVPRLV